MMNRMKHEVLTDWQRKQMRKINRWITRKNRWRKLKRKLLMPFLTFMPAKEIVWRESYGGWYPACPRCGEMIYYCDMCIFCGQRLKDNQKTIGGVLDERED